jgi:hypothetical protein
MRRSLAGAALAAALVAPAHAHGPAEAAATLLDPDRVDLVVDASFTFRWADLGTGSRTGTVAQSFFYGDVHVPPWYPWSPPAPPPGTPIATGIPDTDPANVLTWDTRAVPSGTYWVFSLTADPDLVRSEATLRWSPYPVIVRHAGDPLTPSIVLVEPDSQYDWADERFEVVWSAFDPDGTGRVTLEASTSTEAASFRPIAVDLPASEGRFTWDTRGVPEGDHVLRARIVDARGLSFESYARAFLLVTRTPPGGGRPDAGPVDGGVGDAAALSPPPDAGAPPSAELPVSCATTTGRPRDACLAASLMLGLLRFLGARTARRHPPRRTS